MNRKLYFVTFTVGAVIGSVATWYFVKKKYEEISQEEIDSVKKKFAEKEENLKQREEADYAAIIRRYGENVREEITTGHVEAGETNHDDEKEETMEKKGPYTISPEEFGELDDYEKISLIWYADGVLADDDDEVVDEIEDTVGDALQHFGDYEEDAVFARCDERQCDYEILADRRNFSDVIGSVYKQTEE